MYIVFLNLVSECLSYTLSDGLGSLPGLLQRDTLTEGSQGLLTLVFWDTLPEGIPGVGYIHHRIIPGLPV